MPRRVKLTALVVSGIVLLVQWLNVCERSAAAVWNWYKFWGYGGSEPLVLGKQAQLMFYMLSAAFAAFSFFVWRSSKGSRYETVARWQLRGFIIALVVWTAVLASPLIAPFSSWR